MLVRTTGPVVRHLQAVLIGDRFLETGSLPPESDLSAPPREVVRSGLAQVVASGPGYNEGTAESVMIALMFGARSRVTLTSPYVIPSEPFLAAMCSAARARRGGEPDRRQAIEQAARAACAAVVLRRDAARRRRRLSP
jgi:cardiolipin synthase